MAISNGHFYGEIGGRNLYSFLSELEYDLETSRERIELLRTILYDENGKINPFFERLFEQTKDKDTNLNSSYVKLVINTTDSLYSDTNVANALSKMADYILFSSDSKLLEKENKTKYKIYKDKNLFKKIAKETSIEGIQNNTGIDNLDDVIEILVKESNVTIPCVHKINNEDLIDPEIGDILQKYSELRAKLKQKLEKNKNRIDILDSIPLINDEIKNFLKTQGIEASTIEDINQHKRILSKENKMLIKHIGMLETDMIDVKIQLKRPIEFKAPLSGYSKPSFDNVDLSNPEHVKILMTLEEKEHYNLQEDYEILQYMVNEAIKKTNLTDLEKKILKLIRCGWSQKQVADLLEANNCENVYQQSVSRCLEKISKKIAKQFINKNNKESKKNGKR